MRIILALVFSLMSALIAKADQVSLNAAGRVHQWVFPSEAGNVSVGLFAEEGGRFKLEIDPEALGDDGLKSDRASPSMFGARFLFTPKLSEEAHFLDVVLTEMPSLGYDKTKLTELLTRLQHSVFREEVEELRNPLIVAGL